MRLRLLVFVITLFPVAAVIAATHSGVVTNQSAYSADVTLKRFEAAIKKRGFMVFTRLDHAAAAKGAGLSMPYSTVVVYGNPKAGTPNFLKAHDRLFFKQIRLW